MMRIGAIHVADALPRYGFRLAVVSRITTGSTVRYELFTVLRMFRLFLRVFIWFSLRVTTIVSELTVGTAAGAESRNRMSFITPDRMMIAVLLRY